MKFGRLDPERDEKAWKQLLRSADFGSIRGFESQHQAIFRGRLQVLQNRFDLTRYGLWASDEKRLLACAIHLRARDPGLHPSSCLGGLLFDPSLTEADLRSFADQLLSETGPVEMAPMNGHLSLGLSQPAPGTRADDLTFLCAPLSRQTEAFLRATGRFEIARELHAFTTPITEDLLEKTRAGLAEMQKRGYGSRPLSLIHFKRDVGIYNRIVSKAMSQHHGFWALSFEEEWEVFREALAILPLDWFQFLMHEGKEIGFCFAYPDYNSVVSNERSDARNALAILRARWSGGLRRARLVYSALDPAFQGRGLFKAARHQVILEMARAGVREFESSYVDEGNSKSQLNVKSTGGRLSHTFHLYRSLPLEPRARE